ncbi:MAG: hypothetical protein P8X88_02580 [Gammaproteobacteria bacterium]
MEHDYLMHFRGTDNTDEYYLAVTYDGRIFYSATDQSVAPNVNWKLVSIDESAIRYYH